MRKVVALFIALGVCGCASPRKPQFLWYSFTDGEYSKLLESTFGDDVLFGTNFYVLPNAWNHAEPNGLLISPSRARYVWVRDGKASQVDMTPTSCPALGPLLEAFDAALADTIAYATGQKAYPDLTPDSFAMDPPHYVIQIRGENSNVIIDPRRGAAENFPSIAVALQITAALRRCHDS